MNKKTKKILLSIFTLGLYLLLSCVKLTGGAVHAILGAVLVLVMGIHVAKNRRRRKYVPGPLKLLDNILLYAMILMLVTGLLMHPAGEILLIGRLHKLSAAAFLIGCIVHVLQHKEAGREKNHVSQTAAESI